MLDQLPNFNRQVRQALQVLLPPRSPGFFPATAAANTSSQGDPSRNYEIGTHYSGRIETITLNGCRNVRIEGARIDRLETKNSIAQMDNSRIDTTIGVAIDARDSELIATTSRIQGRTDIRADN
jgi:hypothetical protein